MILLTLTRYCWGIKDGWGHEEEGLPGTVEGMGLSLTHKDTFFGRLMKSPL